MYAYVRSKQKVQDKVGPLEGSDGNWDLFLFLIYINDLDDDITSKVLKFADDTKVFRKIKSDG